MKKIYSIMYLYTVEIDGYKYICEKLDDNLYREVLTGRKIVIKDNYIIKNMTKYYNPILLSVGGPTYLDKNDILKEYINLNKSIDYVYSETGLANLISNAVEDTDSFYRKIGEGVTPEEREIVKKFILKDCNNCANGCCRVLQSEKPIKDCINWENDKYVGMYIVLRRNRIKF